MNISKISAVVFSPTDTTKSLVASLAGALPMAAEMTDITGLAAASKSVEFSAEELAIFAVPVYGGRVPATATERIRNIHGHKTPAVIVVTYGNRAFEDALLELKDTVEENGFVVIAAAAFVTEHSIMHSLAHGRPDGEDNKTICGFAEEFWKKLQAADSVSDLAIKVPGNTPYRDYGALPFVPYATDDCTQCGACAESCPVGAISPDNSREVNEDICISCLRCIKACPSKARELDPDMLSGAEAVFFEKFGARKEPETFI